ncbi:MAG: hypothetical protein RLO53_07615 [Salinisphaeraceae bacterium]
MASKTNLLPSAAVIFEIPCDRFPRMAFIPRSLKTTPLWVASPGGLTRLYRDVRIDFVEQLIRSSNPAAAMEQLTNVTHGRPVPTPLPAGIKPPGPGEATPDSSWLMHQTGTVSPEATLAF